MSIVNIVHILEAAQEMRENRDKFVRNVKSSMSGGYVNSTQYDNVKDAR
jgi:hypothetical protein